MASLNGNPFGLAANQARFLQKAQTLSGSNATVKTAIFTITGGVYVLGLWFEVTTTIGANHTAAYYELNDQTATPDITVSTGITLSGLAVGTMGIKNALTAASLLLRSNAAGTFSEPATAGIPLLSPFFVGKKTAAVTTIDYSYATTDTPTTGALLHSIQWIPLSSDGNIT